MSRKVIKQEYNLYLPKSVNLDSLLSRIPPTFSFKRDKFVYFLHLLSSVNSSRKDEDSIHTTLYSLLLKSKMGSDYNKYIRYLINNNVIITNNRYSTHKHQSKKYLFTPLHTNSALIELTITDNVTIKNIKEFDNLNTTSDLNILPPKPQKNFEYLDRWFNDKLSINFIQAKGHLKILKQLDCVTEMFAYEAHLCDKHNKDLKRIYQNCKDPINAYNKRLIPVYKLKNKQFTTTVDTTSYRFHSPLTALKKELRRFVTYDGKQLVSIDIKNSQPFISTILFNNTFFNLNKVGSKIRMYNDLNYEDSPIAHHYVSQNVPPKDVEKFVKQVVSGKFYEEFISILDEDYLIPASIKDKRSYAKNIVFRTFFSPNYHRKFVEEIKVFEKVYPNVFANFSFIKKGKNFNALACVLQRIESELILEIICKKISGNNPNIPLFTIHDSVVTTIENQDLVKKVMKDILTKQVGYEPQLAVEVWG